MQPIKIPAEQLRGTKKTETPPVKTTDELREQIEQQTEEYEKRGGKISEIPYGVQTNPPGKFVVPADDFSTSRSLADQKRISSQHVKDVGKSFLTSKQAADALGISAPLFHARLRKGVYQAKIVGRHLSGYIFKRSDINAIKKSHQKDGKPCKK